jgi:dipeptidyl aminopeptidase/acylaminoacyl peptidase
MPQASEFGFWKSPITSAVIVAESIRLGQIAVSGEDIYWTEGRPREGGRHAIVRRTSDGITHEVTPQPWNARTRVHEYGGGGFWVDGATVYFTNFADQRLYRIDVARGQQPQPITPESAWRYADGVCDQHRNRLIAVREDHSQAADTQAGKTEAVNAIVAIDLSGERGQTVLAFGADFYSDPRLSPDGTKLCWLEWRHPNMPWDGTELRVAEFLPSGGLGQSQLVAGGVDESIFQPQWSPGGELCFISDRSGWWNLYRQTVEGIEPLAPMEADFGLPQWIFGRSTYAFESERTIICSYSTLGEQRLARLDIGPNAASNSASNRLQPIDTPYTDIEEVRAGAGYVAFKGGSPTEPDSIIRLDLATSKTEVLQRSFEARDDLRRYFSVPETIEFPTTNDLTAHGFFYAPHNPDFEPPPEEKPPLMVISHGGPTGATTSSLSLLIQYWTSRGFGVLDVNYGGSTGYGRDYRRRLNGEWGVVDVDDCTNGALYLAAQGRADRDRLVIRGGSAGGYTTLAALAFRDVFRAGASYYGVSDIEALARDTHKFESRYDKTLVGAPELYRQRSPIHSVDKLTAPVIFFQGSEDKVVLPNQAEMMVDALRKKGVPVCYILFEGEQHGFRRAENIQRALDAELYFYASVFLKGVRF